MRKMIPLNKQSKKKQKAYYDSQRGSWYGVDPVTRVVPSGKLYQRTKERKRIRQAFAESDR